VGVAFMPGLAVLTRRMIVPSVIVGHGMFITLMIMIGVTLLNHGAFFGLAVLTAAAGNAEHGQYQQSEQRVF
jgi:hypothetical protein